MRTLFKWLALTTSTVIAAAFIIFSGYYVWLAIQMEAPDDLIERSGDARVVDRNGSPLFEFLESDGRRIPVEIDEISPNLIHATVSTEDASFWYNPGINTHGLLTAAYENLAPWKGGFFDGRGGSSISQQLAKNLYIDEERKSDRDPLRKIKETVLALELNRRYSKTQILEWYLNQIFYGNFAIGAEAASIRYFGKNASELNLAEAALLAGLPKAPATYDPFTNFDRAKARQETVLDLMVRHGYLSREDAEAAKSALIELRPSSLPRHAPHLSVSLIDFMKESGIDTEGDVVIQTTLDTDLQIAAEEAVERHIGSVSSGSSINNAALVAIDPGSGDVLALVGSADFMDPRIAGQVNNAIALNQPAETVMPFVYLAGFTEGWTPATIVEDEPHWVTGPNGSYQIGNPDGVYRGEVTVREALSESLAVPAVKAMEFASRTKTEHLMRRLGLDSPPDSIQFGHGYALGAADVTLLELTHAYSALANGGMLAGSPPDDVEVDALARPVPVERMYSDGKVVWEPDRTEEQAVPEKYSYLITNILSQTYVESAIEGSGFEQPGPFMSGLSAGNRDAWAVGYTPDVVIGVWVGRSDNAEIEDERGPEIARAIWQDAMLAAHGTGPAPTFDPPDTINFVRVCRPTGQPANDDCPDVIIEPQPVPGDEGVRRISAPER